MAAFDEKRVPTELVFDTAGALDVLRLTAEPATWVNHERDKGTLHRLLVNAIYVVVFLEIHSL